MSQSTQPVKDQENGARGKGRRDGPRGHYLTYETAGEEHQSTDPGAVTTRAPSSILSQAPSAVLRRQPAASGAVEAEPTEQTDESQPVFQGWNFAQVPVHAPGAGDEEAAARQAPSLAQRECVSVLPPRSAARSPRGQPFGRARRPHKLQRAPGKGAKKQVPRWLYHATTVKAAKSIKAGGLQTRSRQTRSTGGPTVYASAADEVTSAIPAKGVKAEHVLLRIDTKGYTAVWTKSAHKAEWRTSVTIKPAHIEIEEQDALKWCQIAKSNPDIWVKGSHSVLGLGVNWGG